MGVLEAAIKNGADKKAIEDSKEVKEDVQTSTTPKDKEKSKSKPPSSPNKKDGTTG
jgi:soluble cytochrome b562